MEHHPKTKKRLRRKAVTDLVNSHLKNYKKIIQTNGSKSDLVGGVCFGWNGGEAILGTARGGGSVSTETIFDDGKGYKISLREIDHLKRRLVENENIGELLLHNNSIVRSITQLVVKALD